MKFTGKFQGVTQDWATGQVNITFSVNEKAALKEIEKIQNVEKLSVEAVKHRERRSLDANALLWLCLGKIAESLQTDKWNVYLQMLRRYGKFTYICVKPNVVDAVKAQWRECEVIGEIKINGMDAIQMLCYFGSSTYNTKEFSTLLDGVISEMTEMGIQAPSSQEMQRALEQWERTQNEKNV